MASPSPADAGGCRRWRYSASRRSGSCSSRQTSAQTASFRLSIRSSRFVQTRVPPPAVRVGARAAVVGVAGIIGPAVVGIAALGADEQALQQVATALERDAGP